MSAVYPHSALPPCMPTYRYPPIAENPLGDSVTTVLVSNLHCSSCVHTIEDAISGLSPRPTSIEVSIVSQSVTVYHNKNLSFQAIRAAIDRAGFDVVHDNQLPESTSQAILYMMPEKRMRHIQQCTQCKKEQDTRNNIGKLGHTDDHDVIIPMTLSPAPASSNVEHRTYSVTLSVGGMTCSSCSNTIRDTVSQLPGVSRVVVNLLEKSVNAIIERSELAHQVAETIEDCGFEARVISVELVGCQASNMKHEGLRTVSFRIDGMFCNHCPSKLMTALHSLDADIEIVKPLTAYTDPILTLVYRPNPPRLTIRTIIATLASAKSPSFQVSLHHPPSTEQLAKSFHAREQRQLLCRLVVAILFAIPTFILGVVFMSLVKDRNRTKQFLMEPAWAGNVSRIEWMLFILATPVMFYSANMFHRRSIKEIKALWRRGSTIPFWMRFIRFGSMNLLVSAGVSVAYFASVALLGLAAVQSPSSDQMGDTTTYFDSVVFLTLFLLTGRYLETYSKARTADAITALGSLRPTEAFLLEPDHNSNDLSNKVQSSDLETGDADKETSPYLAPKGFRVERIEVDLLEIGDIVRVCNGSTPPADGIIVSPQESAFDESSLTGESKLIPRQAGDMVYLGTINKSNIVHIRIESTGGETMLDRIVKVVREGQTRRAPIERVADMITGYFVPVVTLLAVLTWVIWLVLGTAGTLPRDYLDIQTGSWPVWSLRFAIAVFVVACPCGIGLAAPTALLVGSGLAAKFGILARGGGEAFQEMAQLDTIVFDKTGTLTEGGEPRVSDITTLSSNKWDRQTILAIAAELECTSTHPLALAIRNYCKEHGAPTITGDEFQEVIGRGLKAHFPALACNAIIGNEAWMQAHGVNVEPKIAQELDIWKSEAKSVVLLSIQDETEAGSASFRLFAMFAIADLLRAEAPGVVFWLQSQGINTWMISGDNAITAAAVAKSVGIPTTNVIAGVLPHEKAKRIERLQQAAELPTSSWSFGGMRSSRRRRVVAMVGDGINDAPALSTADVGIAIGSGSDVAISSASFILLTSNLTSLITLSDLSRRVLRRVKFNFLWAVVYNFAVLPIAAGALYPAGHIRLDPVWASLAMALSSVSVVCSSLLLRLYRGPKVPNQPHTTS